MENHQDGCAASLAPAISMRQCKTTGSCSTTVLKHFPCAQIPPWAAPAVPTCFTSVQRNLLLGHTEPWGCCPGLKGLKMLRLDGPECGNVGQRSNKLIPQDAGSSRDLCSCQQPCSAAQGHPSWLLALFLLWYLYQNLVWSYLSRNAPVGPRWCSQSWHLAEGPGQEQVMALRCVCTGEIPGCAVCGTGQQEPPAPPWVHIQPVPLCCPTRPTPFLHPHCPGFAGGCLSSCPCRCHRPRLDHFVFYSL